MRKALLVCDLSQWVLGIIANRLSELLSEHMQVTVLTSSDKGFSVAYMSAQTSHSVVHFLSPWDFYQWSAQTYIPCVLTVWHIVDWQPFDRHLKRADAICVGSNQWYEELVKHGIGTGKENPTIWRMHYGVDSREFVRDPLARLKFLTAHALDPATLVFGFAGKASSNEGNRKGLDRLWECLANLQAQFNTPFVLRLAGLGWDSEMIPSSLQGQVILEPFMDREWLPQFYSSLDYYVCTSRYEGVPYPVLESMSCECTVISTEVGVVPEIIIDGRNGFILREDSWLDDFLQSVHRSRIETIRQSCGKLARQTILNRFAWEDVVRPDAFDEVYDSAISHYRMRSILERGTLYLRKSLVPFGVKLWRGFNMGTFA